jgi:polyisoprenyl-teichoic acid--peptidoglycan teichoic acid transferase
VAAIAALPVAVLAACSKDKTPSAPGSPSSSSSSTTTPAAQVTGKGLPADLLTLMGAVYLGGKVAASPEAAAALAKRKPATESLAVAGSVGSWKGTPIAAVTRGNDVTLAVKNGSAWSVVGGWWPSLGVAGRTPSQTMRILVVGSDARPGQRPDQCRGDALHIVGIDPSGVGGIVGIPRDSWVPLATGGTEKINAALVYGGADGLMRTVSQVSGVNLDGYVLTGFSGFRAIVDGVGGIPYISKVMLHSDGGTLLVRVGRNILNGSTGLGLARERHSLPNGDFGRSANQGSILRAALAVAKAKGPAAMPGFLTVIGKNVSTSLTAAQVLTLASAVFSTNPATLPNEVVPGAVGTRAQQSVVLLGSGAQAIFADMKDARLGS